MSIFPLQGSQNRAAHAPAPSGGQVFSNIFSQTLASSFGPLTITIANRFKKTGFLAVPTGTVTTARVSITGPVTRCYIGNQGGSDAYDATSLTQVLFSGGAALSQGVGSTTISDDIAFTYSGGDIIVSVESNNLTYAFASSLSAGLCDAYYNVSVLQADIADKTGYTNSGTTDRAYMVSRVQLDGF